MSALGLVGRVAGCAVGGWLVAAFLWQGLEASATEAYTTVGVSSVVLFVALRICENLEVSK